MNRAAYPLTCSCFSCWMQYFICNNVFWKLHRLCKGLWRQVWRADRQTGQVCPWLGPPGEGAAARVPERYSSSQFLAVLSASPPCDLLLPVWAPCPGVLGHSLAGADVGLLSCVGVLLSLVELVAAEQLWHSWHPAPQSPGSGLNSPCVSLQVAWIVFLFQLSCANHRLGIPLGFPQIIFSLLDSVVYIPVFMQGQSKIRCSLSSRPVGYLLLWNTWCPVKIQLPVKCSCCSPGLCLSLLLT